MIRPTKTSRAVQPAVTSLSAGTGSGVLPSANGRSATTHGVPWVHCPSPTGRTQASGVIPGEQVVLGDRRLDVAGDQLVVLGAPGLLLDLARDHEPRAVGVDLGGVRQQRLVAHAEVVARTGSGSSPGRPTRGRASTPRAARRTATPGRARASPRGSPSSWGGSSCGSSRASAAATARPRRGSAPGRRPPRTPPPTPRGTGCGRGAGSRPSRRTSSRRAAGTTRISRTSRSADSSSGTSAKQPSGSGGFGSPSGQPESTKPSQSWVTPRMSRARSISWRRTSVMLASDRRAGPSSG